MPKDNEGFRPADRLTAWVGYLLYAQVAVAAVALASGYLEYQLLMDYQNGVYTSEELALADGVANDRRQRIIAIGNVIVLVVSGFMILRWIHRANHNARQLGARRMEFSPGWSIGYYFIPFLLLWKPYQAMKEIWKASKEPSDWESQKAGGILGLWWTLWLATGIVGNVAFRAALKAEELQQYINVNILHRISDALGIALAIVLLIIVNRIHAMQAAHWRNAQGPDGRRGSAISPEEPVAPVPSIQA